VALEHQIKAGQEVHPVAADIRPLDQEAVVVQLGLGAQDL
jgi:hypothetical protein